MKALINNEVKSQYHPILNVVLMSVWEINMFFSIKRQRRPITFHENNKAFELANATAVSAKISAGNDPRLPRTERFIKQYLINH